jgi:hypothetical protein
LSWLQIHTANPTVWGDCVGAELYKRYSSACDYYEEAGCSSIPNCHWLPEYDIEVLPNPLNFSKPCHLKTTTSPVENVFLGPSAMTKGALEAQKQCAEAADKATCSLKTFTVAQKAMTTALTYRASEESSSPGDEQFAAAWVDEEGPDAELEVRIGGLGTITRKAHDTLDLKQPMKVSNVPPPVPQSGKPLDGTRPGRTAATSAPSETGYTAMPRCQDPVSCPGGKQWQMEDKPCSTPPTCMAAKVSLVKLKVNKARGGFLHI